MCHMQLQVTCIRCEQSTAVLAEEQRDLPEQEEQQPEVLHQKRSADLVLRQCATCLKSVTAHKVGSLLLTQPFKVCSMLIFESDVLTCP